MTSPLGDKKLTHGMLGQLISTAQAQMPEQPEVEAEEYNWLEPHHFDIEQMAMLDVFGKKLEESITETFTGHCQGEFDTLVTSITQQFSLQLAEVTAAERENNFFLSFTADKRTCGFLNLAPETAIALIGHMLCDFDSSGEVGRKLSLLEESILMDIAGVIIAALGEAFQETTAIDIKPARNLHNGDWPLDIAETEHLTTFALTVDHPEAPLQIEFTILSKTIEPIAGILPRTATPPSKQEMSNMIMQHAHKAQVEVTARLC
ncbi:MAG: hypothetical protein KAR47_16265, partial [Planctomycetes bacterium]|nr:hypothetical protein [Planctomycetota bacterium]